MTRIVFSDGRAHELDAKSPTTVGCSPHATIQIGDPRVSDMHCVIRALKDGGFGLKDLGSRSGTWINDKRVDASRLRQGDTIRVGNATLRFDDGSTPPAAADTADASDDLLVGAVLSGYEIRSVLGHGGMGTVYRALQLSLGREVALKVLKSDLCADPKFVHSFVSEARAAGRFNHPNVVQVFDVVEDGNRPFYSMELLPGGSLEDLLKERGRLTIDEALAAIMDAARGLAYADELGIVHRDIKPDNLMPTAQGTVKICDLGLAADPGRGKHGKVLGTPHFISPEQASAKTVDHRSDLYSLGCTFFRLLTGKNPFQRRTVREILKAHLEAPVPELRESLPEAPEELDSVVTKLLAKDPAARYQHANELVADLEAFIASREPSRRGGLLLLAGLVVVLGGGLIYMLTRDGAKQEPVEIIRKDPDAERVRRQNKELAAENALVRIAKSLPVLERAARLEKMAKAHPGTKAAARATTEAKALRQREAERVAAARKREAAEIALATKITTEADAKLTAGDPLAAWARAVELAGTDSPPQRIAGAVAAVATKVIEAWRGRCAAALAALTASADKPNADLAKLEAAFKRDIELGTAKAPAGTQQVVTRFGGRGTEIVASARKARAEARKARIAAIIAQRASLLIGKDGALGLVRAGRLDAALEKLGSIRVPEEFATEWQAIDDLRRLISVAKIARKSLHVRIDAGQRTTVSYGGEDLNVKGRDGDVLILVNGSGAEQKVELWESPELAYELFGPKAAPSGEAGGAKVARVAALATCLIAHGVPAASRFLVGLANGETEIEPQFPWFALAALSDTTGIPADIGREIEAFATLGHLLRAWQTGADEAATHYAGQLEARMAHSIVGVALGVRRK